jgi:hypothetical protein
LHKYSAELPVGEGTIGTIGISASETGPLSVNPLTNFWDIGESRVRTNKSIIKAMTLSLIGIVGVSLLAATAATAAAPGDQDFTVVNKTGVEIHKLHVSPHSSDEWGEDILGKDTLADGESLDINFSRSEKAAHWDLRIEDSEGHSVTWESLNLLEISEVTLHFKDGKAWADVK